MRHSEIVESGIFPYGEAVRHGVVLASRPIVSLIADHTGLVRLLLTVVHFVNVTNNASHGTLPKLRIEAKRLRAIGWTMASRIPRPSPILSMVSLMG